MFQYKLTGWPEHVPIDSSAVTSSATEVHTHTHAHTPKGKSGRKGKFSPDSTVKRASGSARVSSDSQDEWMWLCPACITLHATQLVQSRVHVWWVDDARFYQGAVQAYDQLSGRHCVWYAEDGQWEFLHLGAEALLFSAASTPLLSLTATATASTSSTSSNNNTSNSNNNSKININSSGSNSSSSASAMKRREQ